MTELITKAEIVTLAFSRDISTIRMPENIIHAVEIKHIKPVLGEDFYNAVITTVASYAALIVYLKPVIAFFVKFYILPEIYNDISNTGVNRLQGNNRASSSLDDLGSARQNCLDSANMYVEALTTYLNDNYSLYPLYYQSANPVNKIQIAGGIIAYQDYLNDDFYNEKEE
jgi:hypothetical protein